MLLLTDVPRLRRSLARAAAQGHLSRPFPGVFTAPEPDVLTRCWAATRWHPGVVITGATALHLQGGSRVPAAIELAAPNLWKVPLGFTCSRRTAPDPWRRWKGDIALEHPASAAVSLAARDAGEAIDEGLRLRLFTLADLDSALTAFPGRPGNLLRRRVLAASSENPWSGGERRFHQLLRAAGITGWRGNVRVCFEGRVHYVDVLFTKVPLAIEFDGFGTHGSLAAFEQDRRKGNDLAAMDYTVLRFTWAMLMNDPEYIVREIRRHLTRLLRQRADRR